MGKKKKKKDETSILSEQTYEVQDTHCGTCNQSILITDQAPEPVRTISISGDKLLECHFRLGFVDQPRDPQAGKQESKVTFAEEEEVYEIEDEKKKKKKSKKEKKPPKRKDSGAGLSKKDKKKYNVPDLEPIAEDGFEEPVELEVEEGLEGATGCLEKLHETTGIKITVETDDLENRVKDKKVEMIGHDIDENNAKKLDFHIQFVLRQKTEEEIEEARIQAEEEAVAKEKEKIRMEEVRNIQKEDVKQKFTFLVAKCTPQQSDPEGDEATEGNTPDQPSAAAGCLQTIYIYLNLTFSKYKSGSGGEPAHEEGSIASEDAEAHPTLDSEHSEHPPTEHTEYTPSAKGSRKSQKTEKFSGDNSSKDSISTTSTKTSKSNQSSDMFEMFKWSSGRDNANEGDNISLRELDEEAEEGDKRSEQGFLGGFIERGKSLIPTQTSSEHDDQHDEDSQGTSSRREPSEAADEPSKSKKDKKDKKSKKSKKIEKEPERVSLPGSDDERSRDFLDDIIEKVEDAAEDVYDRVEDITDAAVAQAGRLRKTDSREQGVGEGSQHGSYHGSTTSGESKQSNFIKDIIDKSKQIYQYESKELIQRGDSEPELTMEDPGDDELLLGCEGCLFDNYETLPDDGPAPSQVPVDGNYTVPESRYEELCRDRVPSSTSSSSSGSSDATSLPLSQKPVKPPPDKVYKEDEKGWKFWNKKKKVELQAMPVPPPSKMWSEPDREDANQYNTDGGRIRKNTT